MNLFSALDSYFTERYMSASGDFQRAVQESDLAMRAGNIDSRNFLLIHGTADTLVHQQHSLVLTKALTDQAIGFRHQVNSFESMTIWVFCVKIGG